MPNLTTDTHIKQILGNTSPSEEKMIEHGAQTLKSFTMSL